MLLMYVFAKEWIPLRKHFEQWGRLPHPEALLSALKETRELVPDALTFEEYLKSISWSATTWRAIGKPGICITKIRIFHHIAWCAVLFRYVDNLMGVMCAAFIPLLRQRHETAEFPDNETMPDY